MEEGSPLHAILTAASTLLCVGVGFGISFAAVARMASLQNRFGSYLARILRIRNSPEEGQRKP